MSSSQWFVEYRSNVINSYGNFQQAYEVIEVARMQTLSGSAVYDAYSGRERMEYWRRATSLFQLLDDSSRSFD